MKKNTSIIISKQNIIRALVSIVLVAIVVNQLLWLFSMRNMHQRQFEDCINQSANDAVWMELSERREETGGFQTITLSKSSYKDSLRYINKEVTAEDSIYNVTIDRQDKHSTEKIIQMVYRSFLSINLNKLDSIFNALVSEKFAIKDSYFNYIDLKSGELIESNKTVNNTDSKYHKIDTITIDISDSIAVVGYASISDNEMLMSMFWQLILSAVLIVIAIFGIGYISKSFVWQWRIEKMRQDSIYAMTHEFKRPISAAMAGASLIPYYIEKDDISRASSYANTIESELTKLTQYIDTIKQLSNSDNSNITLTKTDVDIEEFFKSIVSHFKSADNNGQAVEINLNLRTANRTMYVDNLHLLNVIENLVDNAITYNVNPSIIINIEVSDLTILR